LALPGLDVAILYVVGMAAGEPDDVTRRALRILKNVDLILAEDEVEVQRLLEHHHITTPLAAIANIPAETLKKGDAAVLFSSGSPGPSERSRALVRTAAQEGMAVVPIPGPAFALTALVISGLPAQTFVYLDRLPQEPAAGHELLAAVASERRTLVVMVPPDRLEQTLSELHQAWDDRPLVVAAQEGGTDVIWRGRLEKAMEGLPELSSRRLLALIVGGAPAEPARWEEERLRTEARRRLALGLGSKETSRQLAAESGWPRREVYRLAVDLNRLPGPE